MSKNILILSGGPRRNGNSDILCDQFVKGATDAGNQAEKIFLKDKNINYCTGCGACLVKEGACSQKDDMAEILEKMIAADVIVFAPPIYFYHERAQVKWENPCSAAWKQGGEISEKNNYNISICNNAFNLTSL